MEKQELSNIVERENSGFSECSRPTYARRLGRIVRANLDCINANYVRPSPETQSRQWEIILLPITAYLSLC